MYIYIYINQYVYIYVYIYYIYICICTGLYRAGCFNIVGSERRDPVTYGSSAMFPKSRSRVMNCRVLSKTENVVELSDGTSLRVRHSNRCCHNLAHV